MTPEEWSKAVFDFRKDFRKELEDISLQAKSRTVLEIEFGAQKQRVEQIISKLNELLKEGMGFRYTNVDFPAQNHPAEALAKGKVDNQVVKQYRKKIQENIVGQSLGQKLVELAMLCRDAEVLHAALHKKIESRRLSGSKEIKRKREI